MACAHVDGPPLHSFEKLVWVGDIPALGARRHPDRDALIFADRELHLTYAQLDSWSARFAGLVKMRGLVAGERIAYLGRNSELFYVALFGAIRAGVVLTALNWRLAPPEIRFQLADSGARWVLVDSELAASTEQAIQGLEHPPSLTTTGGADGLRASLADPSSPSGPSPTFTPAPGSVPCSDPVILQLYTSGTTGTPKGVLISHRALSLARHAELISPDFAHVTAGCIALSAMPNFHIGGMSWVLIGLIRFGTVVITADPSAGNMLALMRRYGVEHSWMVPTLIRALVESLRSADGIPRFAGMFYGAMPMDVELLRESMDLFGCAFLQFFGMTEVGGAATALPPRDHDPSRPELLRSVGKPYPGISLEIRDPQGRLVDCGQHGEIWIRSPTVMQGYWNLPDKTAESLVDGWYASGDGGYIDEHGYLYLTDRIKDMIVTGGENVYPVEVEQVLRQHPGVLEAAVVGLPDPRWGERVVAVVELKVGAGPAADDILAFCRGRIADFKCPKQIYIAGLPRTAAGKVQRSVVRRDLLVS